MKTIIFNHLYSSRRTLEHQFSTQHNLPRLINKSIPYFVPIALIYLIFISKLLSATAEGIELPSKYSCDYIIIGQIVGYHAHLVEGLSDSWPLGSDIEIKKNAFYTIKVDMLIFSKNCHFTTLGSVDAAKTVNYLHRNLVRVIVSFKDKVDKPPINYDKDKKYLIGINTVESTGYYFIPNRPSDDSFVEATKENVDKCLIDVFGSLDRFTNRNYTIEEIVDYSKSLLVKLQTRIVEMERDQNVTIQFANIDPVNKHFSDDGIYKYIKNEKDIVYIHICDDWGITNQVDNKKRFIDEHFSPLICSFRDFRSDVMKSGDERHVFGNLKIDLINFRIGPFNIGETWRVMSSILNDKYRYDITIYIKSNRKLIGTVFN